MNIRPISPIQSYTNYQVSFSSKKQYSGNAKEEHYREIGETGKEWIVRKLYEFLGMKPPLSKSEKRYIVAKQKEKQKYNKSEKTANVAGGASIPSSKNRSVVQKSSATAATTSSGIKRKNDKVQNGLSAQNVPKSKTSDYDINDFMTKLRDALNNENAKFGDIVEMMDSKISKLPENDSGRKSYLDIRETAKRSNTSFMPTVSIKDTDLEDNNTIIKKVNRIINLAPENEATVLDVLDWFDKNGEKIKDCNFSIYENCSTSLVEEISSTVDLFAEFNPMTDDVLKKYVKLYKKFAASPENNMSDTSKRNNDASNLVSIFNKYSEIMSKDTAYAFFDELKRTSSNYRHFHDVKFSAELISGMNTEEKANFISSIDEQEAILYERYKRNKKNKKL